MTPRSPSRLPPTLDQRVEIETPEQVVFDYTIAGAGSRAAAALIDYGICFLVFLAIILARALGIVPFAMRADDSQRWLVAFLMIAQFIIVWGYYVLWEALTNGQTPGKKLLRLRVVQDGGYTLSFQASAVRNLVRFIDMQPIPSYAVGLVTVLISKNGKRLGDYAAGTIVVHERIIAAPVAAVKGADDSQPVTALLNEDEYALLEKYLARRSNLSPERTVLFDRQLATRLGDRLPTSDESTHAKLTRLYESERALRARGVASRSDTGAAREQHAIVAAGAERWKEFEKGLAIAQRHGLSGMNENEVVDFVSRYRELSTELARLRTAARGRDIGAIHYLSRLVAGGHNILYRQRQLLPRIVLDFLTVNVPREIRRSSRPILLAAVLLFAPMIITHLAVSRHPSTATDFLPPQMIERARTALEREKRGEGYLPSGRRAAGPTLATGITTNNVQVTYLAFAAGITAGIGTLLILVTNGIMIGAGFGVFESERALHVILAFVAPHGVLELTAICIAAGAGLLLGSAFILPGAMTRREALVVRGRRAIRLIAASSLFLLVAGAIEGFVSPRNLPLTAALLIGGATGILALAYMFAGRSGESGAPEEDVGYRDHIPRSA